MKIRVKREVEARYLSLTVAVRYGDEDMPYDAPRRTGDAWTATIDLDDGRIMNWPQGKTLSFESMKVCDEGVYVLFDKNNYEIARIESYVPNGLLPGEYGDYLSLDIDETGKILNWLKYPNLSDFEKEDD